MQKFVLCRPENGLNDMLNQIELCCNYAQAHNRLVIVDTAFRNSMHFKDAFSKYFVSRQEFLLLANPLSDEALDSLDVFPRFLKGRLSSYCPKIGLQYTDLQTGRCLSFDFKYPHQETVLVHHDGHGGLKSLNCLQRLSLAPALLKALEQRVMQIGQPYAAIHIRHTDVKTSYHVAIAEVRKRQLPVLFVASDNRRVIEDFRDALPETRIISFASLPSVEGQPVHINPPQEEVEVRNQDAILDLLTLAMAKPLILVQTRNTHQHKYSGYSRLASSLYAHPKILRNLLSGSPILAERIPVIPAG